MVRLRSAVRSRTRASIQKVVLLNEIVFLGEYIMGSKKKGAVELIALQCSECKRKNYTTSKNRKNIQGKLELNKYCTWDKKHTLHKETKIK